jgi:hypothetical protein
MTMTTEQIKVVLEWLDGRKTYLIALIGVLYVFGSTLGWWPCDERVLGLLGFGGLAALRKGVVPPTQKG